MKKVILSDKKESIFNTEQIEEIRKRIEHGLSNEQIAIFANENLSPYSMSMLRKELENGLDINYVSIDEDDKHILFDTKVKTFVFTKKAELAI